MLAYIIRFYRFIIFLLLGICTTAVFLFLFYTYYLQDYTDFSRGLKHGLSVATILVIGETYAFIRRQSIFFHPIEIPLTIVGSEKEKGKSTLKSLKIKFGITLITLLVATTMILLNVHPQNLYLKGVRMSLLISAPLFLAVSTFLTVKYRAYLKRLH